MLYQVSAGVNIDSGMRVKCKEHLRGTTRPCALPYRSHKAQSTCNLWSQGDFEAKKAIWLRLARVTAGDLLVLVGVAVEGPTCSQGDRSTPGNLFDLCLHAGVLLHRP